MRVLGIDPGYDRLGIAVLSGDASRPTYVHSECFTPFVNVKAGEKADFLNQLLACGERVAAVLDGHTPDAVALETLFVTKNQKTAMHVAELRGVLLYEARKRSLPIFEYTPSQVKLAVTGHGASDKRGIKDMLERLVTLPQREMLDDEYDAIAVAVTHLSHARVAR